MAGACESAIFHLGNGSDSFLSTASTKDIIITAHLHNRLEAGNWFVIGVPIEEDEFEAWHCGTQKSRTRQDVLLVAEL